MNFFSGFGETLRLSTICRIGFTVLLETLEAGIVENGINLFFYLRSIPALISVAPKSKIEGMSMEKRPRFRKNGLGGLRTY